MVPLKEKQTLLDVFVECHKIHDIIRNGGVGVKWVRLMNVVTIVKAKREDELIEVTLSVTVAMGKGACPRRAGRW